MATKDATKTAAGAGGVYTPGSPYRSAKNVIDFATFGIGASGADTVNVLPMKKGEFVQAVYMRIESPAGAGVTIKLDDSRTGGGAVLAATAADTAVGTTTKAAGAAAGACGTTDGFLTMTTGAAVAAAAGKVTVYAVIGNAF